jgi:hypothetical protein
MPVAIIPAATAIVGTSGSESPVFGSSPVLTGPPPPPPPAGGAVGVLGVPGCAGGGVWCVGGVVCCVGGVYGGLVGGGLLGGGLPGGALGLSACAAVSDTTWIAGTVHTAAAPTTAPRLSACRRVISDPLPSVAKTI